MFNMLANVVIRLYVLYMCFDMCVQFLYQCVHDLYMFHGCVHALCMFFLYILYMFFCVYVLVQSSTIHTMYTICWFPDLWSRNSSPNSVFLSSRVEHLGTTENYTLKLEESLL